MGNADPSHWEQTDGASPHKESGEGHLCIGFSSRGRSRVTAGRGERSQGLGHRFRLGTCSISQALSSQRGLENAHSGRNRPRTDHYLQEGGPQQKCPHLERAGVWMDVSSERLGVRYPGMGQIGTGGQSMVPSRLSPLVPPLRLVYALVFVCVGLRETSPLRTSSSFLLFSLPPFHSCADCWCQ